MHKSCQSLQWAYGKVLTQVKPPAPCYGSRKVFAAWGRFSQGNAQPLNTQQHGLLNVISSSHALGDKLIKSLPFSAHSSPTKSKICLE